MEISFLADLVLIFGVSAIVVLVLGRLNIPSIVGFLMAGVLVGPYGLGLVEDVHEIEVFAEIGVILLLFTIGIEFSLTRLLRMKKLVFGGGAIQVISTIALTAAFGYMATSQPTKAIFFGFLAALSSTAIVIKLLSDRGESDTPHGRLMIGILLFQDLCVVPLMLLIPSLSGDSIDFPAIIQQTGKAAVIVVIVMLSARWIVPRLLHLIVHTKSRELFIITIIFLCLGIAMLTSKFGLSLALGAFIAGIVISESDYAHQALSDIIPFKESFIGLFFVSIGMLMNVTYMSGHCLRIAVAVGLIFVLKILTAGVSAFAVGAPVRTSIHAGLGLAQIGEFSFVLALAGRQAGIITDDFYHIFLSSSVVTMLLTPFMLKFAPALSGKVSSLGLFRRIDRKKDRRDEDRVAEKTKNHVVIIGFGLNGRNLARVLKSSGIPYVVLEMNSDVVREEKTKGEPIRYGDGTSREILHSLNIGEARLVVIAISDPASTRRIVSQVKHDHPGIHIIVRTRYLAEMDDLSALGATEVIPEEFETSVEIFSRVLNYYGVPRNIIDDYIGAVRQDSYRVLRSTELPPKFLMEREELLAAVETETFRIKEDSKIPGHTLKDLHLRKETGVTVIAVQRGETVIQNPSPNFPFEEGDIILLIGKREDINRALDFLESDSFLSTKYL